MDASKKDTLKFLNWVFGLRLLMDPGEGDVKILVSQIFVTLKSWQWESGNDAFCPFPFALGKSICFMVLYLKTTSDDGTSGSSDFPLPSGILWATQSLCIWAMFHWPFDVLDRTSLNFSQMFNKRQVSSWINTIIPSCKIVKSLPTVKIGAT